MPSRRRQFIIQINQIGDAVLVALMFWAAHTIREALAFWLPPGSPPIGPFQLGFGLVAPFRYYKWLYLIALPLFPVVLDANGFYERAQHIRQRQTIWILLKSVAICIFVLASGVYLMRLNMISRSVIILFAGLSLVGLYIKDLLFQAYLRYLARHGTTAQTVVLVGSEDRNAEFERLLTDHPEWNLKVMARLAPSAESMKELPALLHSQPISCVILNVPQTHFDEVQKMILICETEGVEAWLVADFVKTSIARATIDSFYGKPLLVFRTTPEISWQFMVKRVLDIVGAAVGLLIAGPLLMLPVAIAVKLTSTGPILFRQKRSGLHGRRFTMLKFRSMVSNAEMLRTELEQFNEVTGPVFKIKDDPRVTRVGRFLRKTSLDELPQLWNVLVGDMSLVGPRPPIPSEVEKYDSWQRRRLSMKPGLTCLWQISGRSQVNFDQWMKLDLQYIDRWSLRLDLEILLKTIPVVLRGVGAH